jgi:hypothetical protein
VAVVALAACRVNESLCIDMSANPVDPQSGCVEQGAVNVPASRCVTCPDQGCGIDLTCAKSSCVVGPDGTVYVVFCLDATMRSWPAGWRAVSRSKIPTDPAFTDVQRQTCLSAMAYKHYCM